MMASNILSRLLPSADDDYRPTPRRTTSTSQPDVEGQAGMNIDEENLGERFQDQDLEQLLAEAASGDTNVEDSVFIRQERGNPKGKTRLPRSVPDEELLMDEDEDDVPASLLLEARKSRRPRRDRPVKKLPPRPSDDMTPPIPGPSTSPERPVWQKTEAGTAGPSRGATSRRGQVRGILNGIGGQLIADPRERALWKWANVENLDGFLHDVYVYYNEHGIWSILLQRVLRLLSLLFMVSFLTFLGFCIDYSALAGSTKLDDVRVKHCMKKVPFLWNFFIWTGSVWWIYSFITSLLDIQRLWDMHNFFEHLLGIPDRDIQTVSWQYVVGRLMTLRDSNVTTAQNLSAENRRFLTGQSKQRMDAHDIANRLMRKENYWIAIVNRGLLDCTVKLPFLGKRQFFTRTIEWNIGLALMDFVFDENHQIRPQFMSAQYRRDLIRRLQRRFFTVGLLNIIIAPGMAVYYMVKEFFTMFTEYQKNPTALGARGFSSFAEWKFRDFNEVHHMFRRRMKYAIPYAGDYLDQFPKDKTLQSFRFVALVSGALAAVLGVVSLLDPELFLGFEIGGRTVLFWLGIMTPVYLAARDNDPDDERILDPEFALLHVIEYTHYYPTSWQNRLHSDEVRAEFSQLFKLKIALYLEELASVVLAPFVFMFSLPRCAEELIDFFREFTVHVEGLGNVCSFAHFDFTRVGEIAPRTAGLNPVARAVRSAGGANTTTNPNANPTAVMPTDLREDYYTARDNKIRMSMHNFMDQYADNPRRGLGRSTSAAGRRNHLPYLPPIFPGLAASGILGHVPDFYAAGMMGAAPYATGMTGTGRTPQDRAQNLRASYMQQTPRMGPTDHSPNRQRGLGGGAGSPMHSILLEPHHQPKQSHLRPRQFDGIAEHGDEVNVAGSEPRKTSSGLLAEDEELGQSWAVRASTGEREILDDEQSDLEDEEGGGKGAGAGAGVLGLLYQFQKQQAEGRGAHL